MEEAWVRLKTFLVHLSYFQKRKRIQRYGFPVLFTLVIFSLKNLFSPVFDQHSAFLLASFTVAASSWYGGFGPGVLATISAIIAVYFVYFTHGEISTLNQAQLLVLIIFLAEGIIISIFSEARYEVEKQKDEFIAFVSHELKNPLAAIMGFAQLTVRRARAYKLPKVGKYAEEIVSQSERIQELIDDLLDIVKIEVGNFTYHDEVFEINDLVGEVAGHQTLVTPHRKIKLIGSRHRSIFGDRFRIRQVMVNLITNAIKYSPENKAITIRTKVEKKSVIISVKDHGVGISKDEQRNIFSRYYQVKTNKRSEGLGLGLYICSQIVKRHLGKIWVVSSLGKGSIFFVSLPIDYRKLL